jgi:hypothetical protein
MARKATKEVKLSELRTTFYVRTALDQEHVLKLADLYEAGEKLPPLQVTKNNEIIDGRHRKEAMEVAFSRDYKTTVEVVTEEDMPQLLSMALKANEGGSKQPTRGDIIHTIRLMLAEGAREKDIYELLPYPKGATRKYLSQAKVQLKKALVQRAKEDVINGMTVREAADKHDIDVADLKRAISPSIGVNQDLLTSTLADISKRSFVHNRGDQALVKRMVEGFADGDVPEKAVEQVLDKIEKLINLQKRRLEDWRSRFEAAKKGQLVNWKQRDEEVA